MHVRFGTCASSYLQPVPTKQRKQSPLWDAQKWDLSSGLLGASVTVSLVDMWHAAWAKWLHDGLLFLITPTESSACGRGEPPCGRNIPKKLTSAMYYKSRCHRILRARVGRWGSTSHTRHSNSKVAASKYFKHQ